MIDKILLPNPLIPATAERPRNEGPKPQGDASFAAILGRKVADEGVKFSQHASQRLAERGIQLSDNQLTSINGAVEDVAKKGGKESLIMVGDAALVVSVKNRTVITAMDRKSMQGNVFTNIDSAVVL